MSNDYTKPYWFRLISYWVKEHKKNGLTIPFVIGAEQFYYESLSFEAKTVSQLLTEIINSNIDEIITLSFCNNIGDYVLGIQNNNIINGLEFKNSLNRTTLVAALSTEILGTNIESIANSLTEKYSQFLRSKQYSLINFNYTYFNESDIRIIKQSFY